VAEIPAKKLIKGREKKSLPEEFMAEFWLNFGRILPKVAENGAEENFLKKFLILQ
jgi:hypothetical protein